MQVVVTIRAVGVPGVSADWYRKTVEFAAGTPREVQWFATHFTEGGILLLTLLLALAGWRRRAAARERALALTAPFGVLLGYGCSELAKSVLDEERPCRTFADLTIVAATCPPTGDWSFPSNHATIAGGLAAATLLLSRRLGVPAALLAALAAFSRIFVGVHYPHDVLAGLLLGGVVAVAAALLLARLAVKLVPRRTARAPGPPR